MTIRPKEISIHALREEGAAPAKRTWPQLWHFYPRPPRGGRRPCPCWGAFALYFYPRPPRGGRRHPVASYEFEVVFLSTPSARRATPRKRAPTRRLPLFLSTPSARRATTSAGHITFIKRYFYPRPPRGGRLRYTGLTEEQKQFLSTPSARRATSERGTSGRACNISIHALREEGDVTTDLMQESTEISIHALREEGDRKGLRRAALPFYFYPRPPRGGRPGFPPCCCCPRYFYPRPPRGGRLHTSRASPRMRRNFYPRPPRGGRPAANLKYYASVKFLSTPSARRATTGPLHLSRPPTYFYPRPPRGGRPLRRSFRPLAKSISIHALREEGDHGVHLLHAHGRISIHALREEGDAPAGGCDEFCGISIHALREEGDR